MALASDPWEILVNLVIGAFAGGFYGALFFFRKRTNPNHETEKFSPRKMAPTIIVAATIGAIDGAVAGPNSITPAGIMTRLGTYGGAILFVDRGLKILREYIDERRRLARSA